jgi:hypothetical protein
MTIEIAPWDTAETLKTKEDIADYLEAVLEDGDPDLVRKALGNVARTTIAKDAGLPPLPDDALMALGLVLRTLEIGLSARQAAE